MSEVMENHTTLCSLSSGSNPSGNELIRSLYGKWVLNSGNLNFLF